MMQPSGRKAPPARPSPAAVPTGQRVARAAGVVVILVAAAVLAGWRLDQPWLTYLVPGEPTMKANTALGFLVLGVATWF
jgi:hypothetical protein